MGWDDTGSGIERFEYNSSLMQNSPDGTLRLGSYTLSSQTWRYGDGAFGIPLYKPDQPGMYSILLSVCRHNILGTSFKQALCLQRLILDF